MIINGKRIQEGNTFEIFNPYTKDIVGEVIDATSSDIERAISRSYNFQCELSGLQNNGYSL